MHYSTPHPFFCVIAVFATLVSSAFSAEIAPPGKVLDTSGDHAQKLVVSSSFGGPRNTLIFYTFKDQKAVLKVTIDNKNKEFPVSAMIYEFEDGVTEEGLKKWLNNQHSDGLFPDVPEPVKTHEIPAASCRTTAHELVDTSKNHFGEFENYSVTIQVSEVPAIEGFLVKDFTEVATVHVKKG